SRNAFSSRRILVALTMILCLAGLLVPLAQQTQENETTRHLWDTAFIDKGTQAPATRKSARRSYRIITPQVPITDVSADTVIGITLWKLRPTRPADTG